MIPDPIQVHDWDLDDQAEQDDAHYASLHPTAAEIRAVRGWPAHVYVSEEVEALRLQLGELRAKITLRARLCR